MKLFDFGSNWAAFSQNKVNSARVGTAARSIRLLLEKDDLKGLSFLDIGCGSGIFAIAAYQLGASRVVGIDINPKCIVVSERNLNLLAPGAPITFQRASVLDIDNLSTLGVFDLVYAWGSLHHTGSMWDAIRNAATRVSSGGILVLAIYNKHFTSPIWKGIKWFYNHLPGYAQKCLVGMFAGIIYIAKFLVTRRNPIEKERGMDFWYDVIDWIGGYPYEYATVEEIETFAQQTGFTLRRSVATAVPTGCNEFVFVHTTPAEHRAPTQVDIRPHE